MLNRCCALLLCLITCHAIAANDIPVRLGDKIVWIKQTRHRKGKMFVHLHQNEETALKAAYEVIRSEGGRVLTLVHDGERNIVFHLKGVRYEFDPNRMFSDVGIKKTLSQFGPYSKEAHAKVTILADQVKKLLPKSKIIAVHNNQSYSLRDYYPGQPLASDAKAVHVNEGHSIRNFYLVTQLKDYLRLKQLKFNSVLQAHGPEDDGSLSVYLARRPYVNVEAGYQQLAMQITMLQKA